MTGKQANGHDPREEFALAWDRLRVALLDALSHDTNMIIRHWRRFKRRVS